MAAEVPLGTTADLETAVRLRSDALLSGDLTTAARLLSQRCGALVGAEDLPGTAPAVGGMAVVTSVAVHPDGDGPGAGVDYAYAVPGHDVTGERWRSEGGQWRWDAC
ncbi:hypothetical protein GCM10027586_09850 [Kineococcus gypseus]